MIPCRPAAKLRRGLLPLAAFALPAMIPAGEAMAQAVVQPIPGPEADQLAEAMRVLAQQPENLSALLQAGDAALYLGDLSAAQNFYARARDVAPGDGRVAAGHAVLLVRQDRPADALAAFDVAEAAGADMMPYAADRGLAYDLVGNNAAAQAEYDRALTLGPDNVVTLRLAISQAISGNRADFEATLLPLLQQGDLSAFRMRAFALAIVGEQDEAVSIAQTMLPERLSSRLAPYLRYMPRLTRAQQAAAAHLGRFPQAHQIGQDDPAIAGLARQTPVQRAAPAAQAPTPQPAAPTSAPSADARLVPSGAVLGSTVIEPVQQPVPTPGPEASFEPVYAHPATIGVIGELPPVGQAHIPPAPAPTAEPVVVAAEPEPALALQPVVAAVAEPEPASLEPVVVAVTEPAPMAPEPAPAPQPLPAPMPAVAEAPAPLGLTEAFATFVQPAPMPDPVAAGGVDITTIAPPREKPKPPPPPPAPPAPPPVPSRHWVQVATGRDSEALAFDWRRIRRSAGELLQNAKPHLADWAGRTRLLAGPYSAAEAEALVASLKEVGVDSFRFTSAKGEDVRALD